jgi:hypothetical protein
MGAYTFTTKAKGKTAREAFDAAVRQAEWDHGHAGYTGTIAEKSEFVLIPIPDDAEPWDFVEGLMEADDPRIRDKWGPAGCVLLSKRSSGLSDEDEWLFFGWASS